MKFKGIRSLKRTGHLVLPILFITISLLYNFTYSESSVISKSTNNEAPSVLLPVVIDTNFVYENNISSTLAAQTNCNTTLSKVINVPDNFSVEDVKIGLNLSHANRGDLKVELTSPNGTTITLIDFGVDNFDNFDLLLADNDINAINDGSNDITTAPLYEEDRTAISDNPLSTFNGEFGTGDWTLTFCNVDQGTSGGLPLTFNSAKLVFQSTATCTLSEVNAMATCNNNGTLLDYSDDYYTITVNPKGTSLGAAYNISGYYGSTNFSENNIPYDSIHPLAIQVPLGVHTTVIITDADSTGCQVSKRVLTTAECSTARTCYAISDQGNPDVLFKYNSNTGFWTEIGSTGQNGIESLAYDPNSSQIYTVSADLLGLVDTAAAGFTAIGTRIGIMDGPNGAFNVTDVDGLTFDPINNVLWASQRRGGAAIHDYIFQIDVTTGDFVPDAFGTNVDYLIAQEVYDPINGQFVYDIDDLAFDPLTLNLYGIANQGGTGGVLVIYDKTNGTIKETIGNFQEVDDMESLGFYNDGYLYGSTGGNSPDPADLNRFFLINQQDASLVELAKIDTTNVQTDFEACDCLTGGVNEISGTLFQDNDQDGVLTGGDVGFGEVLINLYRDIDGDSLYTPGVDVLVDTTSTGADGTYSFTVATTGDFLVNIDQTELPNQSSMTTDNLENVQFISTGLSNPNNNFGFTFYCALTIDKIYYSDCIDNSPEFTANLQVIVEWYNAPSGENIIVNLDGVPQTINVVGGDISPDTLTFSIPADGSSNHNLTANFTTTTICSDTAVVGFIAPCPTNVPPCTGTTGVGGNVFSDFDYDGTNDDNGNGIQGVQVIIYGCTNGQSIAIDTVFTDADGDYDFPSGIINGEDYRVEFILPTELSYLEPTTSGSNNGTTVQMITAPNCADLGLSRPSDYCQTIPRLAVPCYENGNGIGNTNAGLVSFTYDATGIPTSHGGTQEDPSVDAQVQQVGAVWGTAYQNNNSRLFLSSFLKRFVALENGPGYVYVMDYSTPTPSLATSFNLQGVIPVNGGSAIDLGTICRSIACSANLGKTGFPNDYILPSDPTEPAIDLDAFAKVGAMSFGDIDLSEDGNTLWLVNLYQKAIISVDVSNPTGSLPGTVNQYLLSELTGVPNCTNGEIRPFALEFYGGRGYLGIVCDGSLSQDSSDLASYVLSFDPNNVALGFQRELKFSLDYPREFAQAGGINAPSDWQPWARFWNELNPVTTDNDDNLTAPQPILSDIEFTESGAMVLGFTDRFGHQNGRKNFRAISQDDQVYDTNSGGDILQVCKVNGNWVLEGEAGCNNVDNNPAPLSQTDGPTATGEFYYEDYFIDSAGSYVHGEVATGALALLAGRQEVITTTYDAIEGRVNSQGVRWFNTLNGARNDGFEIVYPSAVNSQTFAKAIGLGDLELLCEAPPIEIGNYVWIDLNEDGIQDPCEAPLANVPMTLFNEQGDSLATIYTDANGQYYFNDAILKASTATTDSVLLANSCYYIVAGYNTFDTLRQTLFDTLSITIDSTGMGTNPRMNDSDGSLGTATDPAFVQDYPFVKITTGNEGEVDHSFDFGFKVVHFDYGDLPDNGIGNGGGDYNTNIEDNGPRHLIIDGLFLGDTIDADLDGFPTSLANGDDTDGLDDEDGVTFFSSLDITPGGTIKLPLKVNNTTGETSYLEAWIDWNNDGLLDPSEMIVNLNDSSGNYPTFLSVTIPTNAVLDTNIGVRFRLSLTDDMTPYGTINSGEVEDYIIQIECKYPTCLPIGTIEKRSN